MDAALADVSADVVGGAEPAGPLEQLQGGGVGGVGDHEAAGDALPLGEVAEGVEQALADAHVPVPIRDADLVDAEVAQRGVAAVELQRVDEAHRLLAGERDEGDRAVVGEERHALRPAEGRQRLPLVHGAELVVVLGQVREDGVVSGAQAPDGDRRGDVGQRRLTLLAGPQGHRAPSAVRRRC